MTSSQKLLAVALALAVIGVPLALKRRGAGDIAADAPSSPASASSVGAVGAVGAVAKSAEAPRPLPKLVDLGTRTCAPCKAMLGVLDELERGYGGQLAVEFINVAEDEAKAAPYAVDVIPTQVFVAPDGKELFRHVGFFSTAAIVQKWGELGFALGPPAPNATPPVSPPR